MSEDIAVSIEETFSLSDVIHFDFPKEKEIMLDDIISHLEGLKKLSKRLPKALEMILKESNITIDKISCAEIQINDIKKGSLEEIIIQKLVAVFPEKEKEKIRSFFMEHKNITALLLAIIATAFAMKSCTPAGNATITDSAIEKKIIEINIGTRSGISDETLLKALQCATKVNPHEGMQATRNFVSLAKRNGGSLRITQQSNPDAVTEYRLEEQDIQQIPDIIPPAEMTIPHNTKVFKDTQIIFRAHDADQQTKGWAAFLPILDKEDKEPRRYSIELSEEIDRDILLSKRIVRGTIEVSYKKLKDQEKIDKIILLSVNEDE